MKHEKLIYGLTSILIIIGAIMQILHLPYGNSIITFSFIGTIIFQWRHLEFLKTKIKELESK